MSLVSDLRGVKFLLDKMDAIELKWVEPKNSKITICNTTPAFPGVMHVRYCMVIISSRLMFLVRVAINILQKHKERQIPNGRYRFLIRYRL